MDYLIGNRAPCQSLLLDDGSLHAVGLGDLAQKLNEFFQSSYADGSMMQIAETYGVQAAIIEQ